jgi:very-short-patch-repair endonuclease
MAKKSKEHRKTIARIKHQKHKAFGKVREYLISIGVEVIGVKHKAVIKLYAEKMGMSLVPGKSLDEWAIENVLHEIPIQPFKKPKVKKAKKRATKKSVSLKEIAEQFAEENRKKPTPAVKHFRKLMQLSGFRFKTEKIIDKHPSFILVDFYVPDRTLCIELDGGYHNTPEQKEKDLERDTYLAERGFNNWRMTNEEALALTRDDVIEKIKSFTPRQTKKIRVLAYQEPRPPKFTPKLKGNPPAARRRTKLKRKPTRPNLPSPSQIAENKARREQFRAGL